MNNISKKMIESGVLNLSKQFLSGDKLASYLSKVAEESIHTLILDDNYLRKIEPKSTSLENVMQVKPLLIFVLCAILSHYF